MKLNTLKEAQMRIENEMQQAEISRMENEQRLTQQMTAAVSASSASSMSTTATKEESSTTSVSAEAASESSSFDQKDEELRLRLEQKLIKEQEEIKFKQLQKEAMRIQKELEVQRGRMEALSPPVSKKSSLFIHVENKPGKPTPAQKACVHQTKVVNVNNNNNGGRMSQSLSSSEMFNSSANFDARLLSPQFMSSGTNPLETSMVESASQWESRQFQQQQFRQQQQQLFSPTPMQQSSQEGAIFQLTAMPLQSVGSIFKNNINQLG